MPDRDPVLVGVGLDGLDAAPLAFGQTLAPLTTRRLVLLHAYPYEPLTMPAPEYDETLRAEATANLERLAEWLDHDLDVTVLTAPRGFARIGVGFDDRAESRDALDVAIALARAAGAELTVYTVFEPVETAPAPTTPGWVVPQSYADERRERAEAAVRAARERVPGDLLAGAELLTADAAGLLAEVTSELDLMVCGSRGYGPLRAVLLGSVSARLVRNAESPLLITPRGHGGRLVRSR